MLMCSKLAELGDVMRKSLILTLLFFACIAHAQQKPPPSESESQAPAEAIQQP